MHVIIHGTYVDGMIEKGMKTFIDENILVHPWGFFLEIM